MPVLIGIHSKIYEVSDYYSKHPGEGIMNVYLKNFHRKNPTDLFERYHNTNESDELLIEAQNNNFKKTQSGISFVCPFFFKHRIPKYFHYINEDNLENEIKKIFSGKENNCFIVRRNIKDNEKTLIITYFVKNNNIISNKYIIKFNNLWLGSLYFNNKIYGDKEKDVEKLIENMMKEFEPIYS